MQKYNIMYKTHSFGNCYSGEEQLSQQFFSYSFGLKNERNTTVWKQMMIQNTAKKFKKYFQSQTMTELMEY